MRIVSKYTTDFLVLLTSAATLQTLLLLAWLAWRYVLGELPAGMAWFGWENFRVWFVAPVVNAALLGSWALLLFGEYFSPLTILIVSGIYGAAVKYLTGSLLLFVQTDEPRWLIGLAFYTYLAVYFGFLWFGEVQTAEKYRIKEEE